MAQALTLLGVQSTERIDNIIAQFLIFSNSKMVVIFVLPVEI